jgi:Luciferase-like monooxygenase
VGVGSLRAEFALLGSSWDDRGGRADDAIRALRGALSNPRPAHHGSHCRYESMIVEPCAVQERVPIWVGGRTRRSLRRAVELGDGWMPFGLTTTQLAKLLATTSLPEGLRVVLSTQPLDPMVTPQHACDQLGTLADTGATDATCVISARSAAPSEQLAALESLTNHLREESATSTVWRGRQICPTPDAGQA